MIKFVFSGLLLLTVCLSSAEIRISGDKIRIANEKVMAVIDLAHGAQISSFQEISGKKEYTALVPGLPGGSGLFADGLFDFEKRKVFRGYENQKYRLIHRQDGPEARAAVVSPGGMPLDIRKEFILSEHSHELKVEYTLTNPGSENYIGAFRLGNAFRFPGTDRYQYDYPQGRLGRSWAPAGPKAKIRLFYEPGKSNGADHFIHQPDSGQVAVLGRDRGILFTAPFPLLSFFYSYFSPASNGMAVADYFSMPFELPPLDKGKKEAVLHTVLDNPLAAYQYRFSFSMKTVVPENFSYALSCPADSRPKSKTFAPSYVMDKMFQEYPADGLIWNPSPRKKLRVLMLSAAHGNAEAGELQRRLNLDLTVIDTSNITSLQATSYFGWKIPLPEVMLKKALEQKFDVFLICGHHEKAVSRELVQKITEQVENGAAFIYVSEKNHFPSLIPVSHGQMKAVAGFKGVLAGRLPGFAEPLFCRRGKGTVFHLKFQMCPHRTEWLRESRVLIPHVEKEPAGFPYWEYYFAFYGKLLRTAVGHQPEARINSMDCSGKSVKVRLQTESGLRDVTLEMQSILPLSGLTGRHAVWKGSLPAGTSTLDFPLPAELISGVNGTSYYNIWIRTNGETVDYFSAAKAHSGTNGISSLTSRREIYEAGEKIDGSVRIAGQGELIVSLKEISTGRIADRRRCRNVSGAVQFQLQRSFASYQKLYEIVAELYSGGKMVDCATCKILLRPSVSRPEKIRPLLWGQHFQSWRDRSMIGDFADLGFRIFEAPVSSLKSSEEFRRESETVLAAGMEYAPLGIAHFRGQSAPEKSSVRIPCLRDPVYREKIRRNAERTAEKLSGNLCERCYISDEVTLGKYFNSPHDFCFSEHCLAAFRKWLENLYGGDLNRLNRDWKENFASWAQVVPLTRYQAGQKNNSVSFIMHRYFMMNNLTDISREIARVVKDLSGAEVGYSGMDMTKLYQGYDLLATMPFLKCSAYYHNAFTLDAVRSAMSEEHTTGSYTDYGARHGVWEQIIGGLKTPAVWWYGHLIRRGDARFSSEALHLKKIFTEIRESGADYILGYGRRKKSPITLVWSTASLCSAEAFEKSGGISQAFYRDTMNSYSLLIRDMGLDAPNVIADDQIKYLNPVDNPVVILPLALMISEENIRRLEKYVQDGGFLIADLLPGTLNEFAMPRVSKGWMSMWGIAEQLSAVPMKSAEVEIGDIRPGGFLAGTRLTALPSAKVLAHGVRRNRGARLGSMQLMESSRKLAPAVLLHHYGRGRTLYLNFVPGSYASSLSASPSGSRQTVKAMQSLLQEAGLPVDFCHRMPGYSNSAEYTAGQVRYFFISRRKSGSDGAFTLNFKKNYAIFDMLEHCFIKSGKQLSGSVKGNGVVFYALYPEKPGQFQAAAEFDGRRIKYRIREKSSGFSSAVSLTITHDRREMPMLSERFLAGDRAAGDIDLGLEPPAGEWGISIKRIADNAVFQKKFKIPGR